MARWITLVALTAPLIACSSTTGVGDTVVVADAGNPFATRTQDAGTAADVEPTDDTSGGPVTSDTPPSSDTTAPACEEGKACNDGDLCTKNDVCTDGVCAGVPTACEAPEAPCATATCVEGICEESIDDGFCFIDGNCWTEGQPNEAEPCQRCIPVISTTEWSNNDGESCGDGDEDPCAPYTCQGGTCVGTPVLCEADDGNPCTADTCVGGACEQLQVSGDCDDGDPCTTGDVCDKGNCIGGAADCDDGLECTTDSCAGDDCLYVIDPGMCAIDGLCIGEGETHPDTLCQVCDPTSATDAWTNLSDVPCSDGSSCTSPDTCQDGVCVGGPMLCPDDGNPCTMTNCTDEACIPVNTPEGTACDDGDDCTTQDACTVGVCVGQATDCDDELTCTTDACDGTLCLHTVAPGFCAIDGMCLANGEANPTNPCEVCDATSSPEAWTPLDGVACDDGSACTQSETCQAGVCTGGQTSCPDDGNPCTTPTCDNNTCDMVNVPTGLACDDSDPCTTEDSCSAGACVGGPPPEELCDDALDNDCDGSTDEDCEATGCVYHADCYPETLCGNWYTTGETKCSDPCAGDSDCPMGFICSKVPGSINAGYCEPAIGIGGQDAPCVDGTTCGTGLCIDGACAGGCLDDQHCTAAGHTCQMIGDLAVGYVGTACTPDGALKPQGQMCTDDGFTWDSFQCASGHCDLSAPTDPLAVCSNTCTSQSDCMTGQICGIVFHAAPPIGTTTNPDSVPYHPLYALPTYDGIAGCHSPLNGTGFGADGIQCTQDNQCQSGHCLPLIPDDDTRFCTRMCSLDSDCQNTMQCKIDVVNLTSGWLEAQGTHNVNAFSLVRLCKFP